MRYLKHLLSFKTPSSQRVIDIALITALLPHIFIAKFPILLFMLVVLIVLISLKDISKYLIAFFAIFGLFAILISFLGSFNFVGFSELSVFTQLISSLLIYAVSLQRLSKQVNFYLLISPMLLLALSYFFYNTIFMLIYSISALYIFLLLLLWAKMHSPLVEAIRSTSTLFMMSLPFVVILFMVFPRISFDKKDFGFKDTASLRTGHDGLMHIGSDALLVPSKKVAMEVFFNDEIPDTDALYFRGSVLYVDKGETWVPFEKMRQYSVLNERESNESVSYNITLYPHKKRWLFLLDYPFSIGRKSNFSHDLIATWDKPITEIFRYKASSILASSTPQVERDVFKEALVVHKDRDKKTQKAMNEIAQTYMDDYNRYSALNIWFTSQKLNYTLKPDKLDLNHPIDSFIYDTKKGYCVHFASSYATMARMLGIPSRVVTGFKGDASKSVENYLVVREEDAHAWVEVYLKDRGWLRVDPTKFSAGIASGDRQTSQIIGQEEELSAWEKFSNSINLYSMYTKYVIQQWILYYDRSKQMQLLRELMDDTILVLKFAGLFLLLIAIAVFSFIALKRQSCSDEVLCAIRPLLKALKKIGIEKKHGEDMHSFLLRANSKTDSNILEIDILYHELRYGKEVNANKLKELNKLSKNIVLH